MRRLMESVAPAIGCVAIGLLLGTAHAWAGDAADSSSKPVAPGLREPGILQRVAIETGLPDDKQSVLRGSDARQQLIVTGSFAGGQTRDLTRSVAYEVSPEGIVHVDDTGLATPLGDGTATISVRVEADLTASTRIRVERFTEQIPINFANQIVPIFTKLGCNSGGCHGKASGQNGFKLSLLGFYPADDYEFLVKESRGRRLFPAAPDRSLLLEKATNRSPHGGGARVEPNSYEYRLLRRWIAQGMPYGSAADPTVARIEVFPRERAMQRSGSQQVAVLAHYTDGSTEDVTRMTQFDANDTEMAEASATGLVQTRELTGDVAIMARYQGQVATFRATVPLGLPIASYPEFPANNFIDQHTLAKWKQLGIVPSDLCSDSEFIRRAMLDICGTTPTAEEVNAFVSNAAPDKRAKLVDQLLDRKDYADFFTLKWA
ncbi:MAG: DUF1549 domain-containing protein, partial [Planctomycetes bacterium]|nr:DUF1549 domain-containing protein [Planctomycetota bacterium]